jgi:general secretion pathway protein G
MNSGSIRILPPSRRAHAAAGFSLLEMIIVLVLMGLIAALVVPRLTGVLGKNKVRATKVQIQLLATAIERYQIDVGQYPTQEQGFNALLTKPQDVEAEVWDGPYTEKNFVPKDAWNHEFIYNAGKDSRYVIMSYGADGQPGGEGDNADLDNRNT